jgi:demethoxyubiquinone hydroxylase (CLK1/Coq7/Cat5 family)
MQNEYEKQLEQLKNTVHKLRSQQEKDRIDEGNRLEDAKVITSICS